MGSPLLSASFEAGARVGLESLRVSPRSPPGRMRMTPTIRTPIMKKRKLGSEKNQGRNWVPDQIPHTTKAPRMAPRLFPEPPTISMAQMTKVARRGSKVTGAMKRM